MALSLSLAHIYRHYICRPLDNLPACNWMGCDGIYKEMEVKAQTSILACWNFKTTNPYIYSVIII